LRDARVCAKSCMFLFVDALLMWVYHVHYICCCCRWWGDCIWGIGDSIWVSLCWGLLGVVWDTTPSRTYSHTLEIWIEISDLRPSLCSTLIYIWKFNFWIKWGCGMTPLTTSSTDKIVHLLANVIVRMKDWFILWRYEWLRHSYGLGIANEGISLLDRWTLWRTTNSI
jgi:hypothetical protein